MHNKLSNATLLVPDKWSIRSISFPTGCVSQTRSNSVATINSKVLTIEVLIRNGEQHRLRHIDVLSGPSGGKLALILLLGDVALLVLVGLSCGHLGGEDAGC